MSMLTTNTRNLNRLFRIDRIHKSIFPSNAMHRRGLLPGGRTHLWICNGWYVPRELTAVLVKFIDHGGTISCGVRGRPQQGKGLEVPVTMYYMYPKRRDYYKSTLRISKSDYAINVCVVQCYI